MLARFLGFTLFGILLISGLGVCTAYAGLLSGNSKLYRVGMIVASPCYLFMAFTVGCIAWGEMTAAKKFQGDQAHSSEDTRQNKLA